MATEASTPFFLDRPAASSNCHGNDHAGHRCRAWEPDRTQGRFRCSAKCLYCFHQSDDFNAQLNPRMKRGLIILAVSLLVGLAGFIVSRQQCSCGWDVNMTSHEDKSQLPELEWLQREFGLSNDQFTKVSALHLAYRPVCEDLCMKVMASHEKVKRLVHNGTQVSPDLISALEEHAALHVKSQTAMLAHLYRTAECMTPEQAKRYLDIMLPQVIEMAMEPESMSSGH